MPGVGFELTISAFERAKAVHALDRAATVISLVGVQLIIYPRRLDSAVLSNVTRVTQCRGSGVAHLEPELLRPLK
jgi:hypothetical protein